VEYSHYLMESTHNRGNILALNGGKSKSGMALSGKTERRKVEVAESKG